ncbi:RNA polymerase sigma-70 factor [Chitinophaga arvensicola]|uniref:RNA polymerase sigma-70 factor, ECF subfamily n=1 Tax=Chitinophaga arvensicola TaxID=29529 RepID=A0A1I0RFH1_9BACT|nr:RNA polymerase sigma-70 factor [Chitinophaga arvensicola]SEW38987.1 RNA polymerase sigma-70 factor, ECF subfamily [Chitinophaga arvensicola]
MPVQVQPAVSLWLQGDDPAFKVVFDHYYPRLHRYAIRYLKNEVWAEDTAMEVLAKVWEKKAIITAATFENYLFTIARNQVINLWKKRIEVVVSYDTLEDSGLEDATTDPLLTKELEAVYQQSIAVLPQQRQTIYRMHRNEKLSYKEIADILHISPKTVENQMGAALKHLRAAMMQYLTSVIL